MPLLGTLPQIQILYNLQIGLDVVQFVQCVEGCVLWNVEPSGKQGLSEEKVPMDHQKVPNNLALPIFSKPWGRVRT